MGQLFVQRQQSRSGDSLTRFGPNKICKDFQSDLHNIYEFESTSKMQSLSLESKRRNTRTGKTPRNAMEFEREWRQCWSSNSPVNALKYLLLPKGGNLAGIILGNDGKEKVEGKLFVPEELRLSPERIAEIHRIEMDANTMEQIIESLHLFLGLSSNEGDAYSVTVVSFLRRWMISLTKCGRFSLNVEFLDANHKHLLLGIMEYLVQERVGGRSEELNGDKEDVLNNLLMLYKINNDAP